MWPDALSRCRASWRVVARPGRPVLVAVRCCSALAFRPRWRWDRVSLGTNRMNVALIALGCILVALGLMMSANRAGYIRFIVGPGSVLIVAGAVAIVLVWILGAPK
jgi:hypothetical protein